MASKMSSESLKNLCECPVCFEPYTDPRLLKCGHQFCEKCLKDIADHAPQGHIPCPVCREITKLQHGDVTTLPRSTLHQYMQELIFRQPTEEALGQKCTKCKVNKSTRHCPECSADLAYLCDKCYEVHQKMKRFTKHNTVQFDALLICPEHSHKMVENFCYDCNAMACVECMFDNHADHETEYLDAAAEKARKVLSDHMTKLDGNLLASNIIHHLKHTSVCLGDDKKTFTSNVENIKLAWNKLEAKLDDAVETLNATIEKEIQRNSENQAKVAEVRVAQEKMLMLVESLLKDVCDPQVIMGSRDLPEPDIDITEIEVKKALIGEQFRKMAADLETMANCMDKSIVFTTEVCKIERRKVHASWDMQHVSSINIGHTVVGFSFIGNTNEELLVRSDDKANPIRVYNKEGDLIKQMGADIKELTGHYRQVCMDNHRELYLIMDNQGCLIRMESDGTVRDTTHLGGVFSGVAYIAEQDMYVLSAYSEDDKCVFLMSPDTLTEVISLGDEGTFSTPYNVCVGDINGSTTIVVSDCGTNTLYLYSVSGELIKTYGPETHTLGRLNGIWGVSVDKTGHIVVCDINRVLRVWSDKDGDHWEYLLDKEQLGGRPRCVDINNDNRLMAVGLGKTVKLYTC